MNTYEITYQLLQLIDMMNDPEVDPETIKDTYETVEGERSEKFEGCVKVIRNFEHDINAYKEEINYFQSKIKTAENTINRIKKLMQDSMEATGDTKVDAGLFKVSLQNNPPSLFIPDESLVPEKYLVPQPPKVDKTAIKEALKNGETIDFATLQVGKGVRIR